MKLPAEKKPVKTRVEIDEDKRNLLEYEAALNRFGKVTKMKDPVLDAAMASHVVEENLNDPNFLEDDLVEDMGDSMEVLPRRLKNRAPSSPVVEKEDIIMPEIDREPLAEIEILDLDNDDVQSEKSPRVWKRKTPIEQWLDHEPLSKKMSVVNVPLRREDSFSKRNSIAVPSKNEDLRTFVTRSSGSGSGSGSKKSNFSMRTGLSNSTISNSSSGSTIELEARIIDAVTRLEIKKFKQVKASRFSFTVKSVLKLVFQEFYSR